MQVLTQQQKICQTVQYIPLGQVATYGQIADLAGLPRRARLVGRVLSTAPKHHNINWHRVLRSDGQIAFAQGSEQADLQKGLLQQDNIVVVNNRVKLTLFQWQPDLAELLWKLAF